VYRVVLLLVYIPADAQEYVKSFSSLTKRKGKSTEKDRQREKHFGFFLNNFLPVSMI